MMMVYGMFVFGLSTAAYEDLQRQTSWRHETTGRVGVRPARQFLGPGDDTIRLSGRLLPQFTGGRWNLEYMRRLADTGKAAPLIEGTGFHYGFHVITSLNERQTLFMRDGAAERIEFDLALARVDEGDATLTARLDPMLLGLSLDLLG